MNAGAKANLRLPPIPAVLPVHWTPMILLRRDAEVPFRSRAWQCQSRRRVRCGRGRLGMDLAHPQTSSAGLMHIQANPAVEVLLEDEPRMGHANPARRLCGIGQQPKMP